MSADVVEFLLRKAPASGEGRPTIALDADVILDVFKLMNTINKLNDRSDHSRTIELVIPAISLAALKQRLGARFELWRSVLRAKNVVVKGFEETDAILGPAQAGAQAVTVEQLFLGQVAAEGYLLVTNGALPEAGGVLMHTSPDEAVAAVECVLNLRTAILHVRDPNCALDVRNAALTELLDAASEDLPALLAEELERSSLAPAWRDALVFALEHTQVTDAALRARVIASLLRHALALRDEGSEGPLWSAVRRYASMVPVEASDGLLEFLRPEDVTATKQVALQGVFNIYSHEAPRDGGARDRLRARVRELAEVHIDREHAQDAEQIALAHTCFRAAAALDDPELDELFARIESLGLRRITERAATLRDELRTRRARTGGE